jgi:hypothetical protein
VNTPPNIRIRQKQFNYLRRIFIGYIFACITFPVFAVNFDIIYVRQPRFGDRQHIQWPEAFNPAKVQAGSDLVLLRKDGSEIVLFDTEDGAVTDPFISFDGEWVYFSFFPDVRPKALNKQRNSLPKKGADIYKLHIKSQKLVQLTHQEFTPNTGSGNWDTKNAVFPGPGFNGLGYGILNLSPAPIAGGKIVFSSSRNGFKPSKSFTTINMQLFVMDEDGKNVELVTPMTLGSALHPTPLKDGRIVFSSYESQGLRDRRLWGLWSINPDGRNWEPVVSAFGHASVFHFMTQTSNGRLVFENYYNKNNYGFGALYSIPIDENYSEPRFFGPKQSSNPAIPHIFKGQASTTKMSFSPKGIYSMTPLSTAADLAPSNGAGKYTHPSAAPNNDLLVVWSDGPVNSLNRPSPYPSVDSGIYLIENSQVVNNTARQVKLIKNDPNYNEAWPRAVVPYKEIYGVSEPLSKPWLPNNGQLNKTLPSGTPFGLIGTSSFYNRETTPGDEQTSTANFAELDAFNTTLNGRSSNWILQGADAGKYSNDDIWAVRIIAMEPSTHKGYGPGSSNNNRHFFYNHANERLRILGEIPLLKFDKNQQVIKDQTGAVDTSFLAKIPADVPFTFQTLDKNGSVLNMSQTWHQVRPGEVRNNCGGCHAHSLPAVDFNQTAAAKPDYAIWDLTDSTPLIGHDENDKPILVEIESPSVDIEFYRDIRPVLQKKCISCHQGDELNAPARLTLDNHLIDNRTRFPNDYARLCSDRGANWGIPPIIKVGKKPVWAQTNASRYVRKFQSRRSLLIWKILGQRTDGWNNDDHPTESIPGIPTTIPKGTLVNDADLDFTGTIMPPLGSDVPPLTTIEKSNFIRWIDLGCPIDTAKGTDKDGFGWFLDETRPTLTLSSPRAGINILPVTQITIGFDDYYSGIDQESFSVKANFIIDNNLKFSELSKSFKLRSPGVYEYTFNKPIDSIKDGIIEASVKDLQGNINRITRHFSIAVQINKDRDSGN